MGIESVKEFEKNDKIKLQIPKGKKQILMDEREVMKHMLKKHRKKTLKFY